jgi:hypothetical protein
MMDARKWAIKNRLSAALFAGGVHRQRDSRRPPS